MIRKLLIIFIGITPFGVLRKVLYRLLLQYSIDKQSKIGFLSFVDCEKLEMTNAKIGSFNLIQVKKLIMDETSIIGRMNKIRFINTCRLKKNAIIRSKITILGSADYFSPFIDVFNFEIGENSLLTNNHYFDCPGNITIGDNVVFGGINSQLWTHGFDTYRTMIVGNICIGNNVYIGSGVYILQNVKICDNVIIGAGSIVSKSIVESGFYVSSTLIKKSELQNYSVNPQTIEYNNAKFYRK